MSNEKLVERITAYLSCGGMFNPELAIHDTVSGLLFDCREGILALEERVRELEAQVNPKLVQCKIPPCDAPEACLAERKCLHAQL